MARLQASIQTLRGRVEASFLEGTDAACEVPDGLACRHGTFVAGILHARRDRPVPGICPGCNLFSRPIFFDVVNVEGATATASLERVANAIVEAINAGARIINLSVDVTQLSSRSESIVEAALEYAAQRGVLVVAAAGNRGILGSSVITRHPWVIPVVGCDAFGRILVVSNLSSSVGRRGLAAPGHDILGLAASGGYSRLSGSSVAAPFVTGCLALLCSIFERATAAQIRYAAMGSARRRSVSPPLLDAWDAYSILTSTITDIGR